MAAKNNRKSSSPSVPLVAAPWMGAWTHRVLARPRSQVFRHACVLPSLGSFGSLFRAIQRRHEEALPQSPRNLKNLKKPPSI